VQTCIPVSYYTGIPGGLMKTFACNAIKMRCMHAYVVKCVHACLALLRYSTPADITMEPLHVTGLAGTMPVVHSVSPSLEVLLLSHILSCIGMNTVHTIHSVEFLSKFAEWCGNLPVELCDGWVHEVQSCCFNRKQQHLLVPHLFNQDGSCVQCLLLQLLCEVQRVLHAM
jgi:hypothetical protein